MGRAAIKRRSRVSQAVEDRGHGHDRVLSSSYRLPWGGAACVVTSTHWKAFVADGDHHQVGRSVMIAPSAFHCFATASAPMLMSPRRDECEDERAAFEPAALDDVRARPRIEAQPPFISCAPRP